METPPNNHTFDSRATWLEKTIRSSHQALMRFAQQDHLEVTNKLQAIQSLAEEALEKFLANEEAFKEGGEALMDIIIQQSTLTHNLIKSHRDLMASLEESYKKIKELVGEE